MDEKEQNHKKVLPGVVISNGVMGNLTKKELEELNNDRESFLQKRRTRLNEIWQRVASLEEEGKRAEAMSLALGESIEYWEELFETDRKAKQKGEFHVIRNDK